MAAKAEKVSLEDAAKAYVLVRQSSGGSNRKINRLFGLLAAAVNEKDSTGRGPIVPSPEDQRPEMTAEQEAEADNLIFAGARIDDLIHPGGRLQDADETIAEIIKQSEEGTSDQDNAQKIAASAKESAEKYQAEQTAEARQAEGGKSAPKAKDA